MFFPLMLYAATGAATASTPLGPSSDLQLSNPSSSFNISNQSLPSITFSNTTNGGLSASDIPRCNVRYGYDLNRQSCLDAWRSIPTDDTAWHTFGRRLRGDFEFPAPYRFLSADGLCAIDVSVSPGGDHDTAQWTEISTKAKSVLDACVMENPGTRQTTGGAISHVGKNGNLYIKLSDYKADVTCRSYPPYLDRGRCSYLLGTLPVSGKQLIFSKEENPVGVKCSEPEGLCTVIIDLEDQEDDSCSWADLWAGAVAVEKICVQKGKAGMAFGLGKDGRLTVEMGP